MGYKYLKYETILAIDSRARNMIDWSQKCKNIRLCDVCIIIQRIG